MTRSFVLVLVLTALCSPAEALRLAFADQPQVTVPSNGGFWVTGREEIRECDLTLRRGKAKIRLDVITTTDHAREFGHPIHYLLPREPLRTGKPYQMRYRCPGDLTWTLTNSTATHGVPVVAFHGTGKPDQEPPRWTSAPVNIWQAPLCPICGRSTMELSLGFTMPVQDDSPMRIHATFSKAGSYEPSFSTTLVDHRFDVRQFSEHVDGLLKPGDCYEVTFCATDSSGNQSCSPTQAFVREVESCWADQEVSSSATQIDQGARNLWCQPPAAEPAPESDVETASNATPHRQPLLLGACFFLLLLLRRLRQSRRANTRLGRL